MAETTLTDVEQALIDASNRLLEINGVRWTERYMSLDKAIDDALRLVQAWKGEAQ